jgi:hypothetical protein
MNTTRAIDIPVDMQAEFRQATERMSTTQVDLFPRLLAAGMACGKQVDPLRLYKSRMRGRDHAGVPITATRDAWATIDALAAAHALSVAVVVRQLMLWGLPIVTAQWEQAREAETHARIMKDLGVTPAAP